MSAAVNSASCRGDIFEGAPSPAFIQPAASQIFSKHNKSCGPLYELQLEGKTAENQPVTCIT